MRCNLSKQYDHDCKGNKNLIRKNFKDMEIEELIYVKEKIKNIDIKKTFMTYHALTKNLLSLKEIKEMIKNDNFDIIDFNYHTDIKVERVLLRSKKTYQIEDIIGNNIECYCKIVLELTTNTIVTLWMNNINDEERKQKTLKTKYNSNFNIITKKINN
jgi:hypothetical protein